MSISSHIDMLIFCGNLYTNLYTNKVKKYVKMRNFRNEKRKTKNRLNPVLKRFCNGRGSKTLPGCGTRNFFRCKDNSKITTAANSLTLASSSTGCARVRSPRHAPRAARSSLSLLYKIKKDYLMRRVLKDRKMTDLSLW